MTPTETQDTALAPETTGVVEAPAHEHSHEHHHHTPTLNPELTRTIEVEAPAADVDKAFQKAVKRYASQARIPGFRAGKVPAAMIKSRFAKELRQEVLESLVSDKFRSALDSQKFQPISQPQVSELFLVEGQPLKFKATFETLPEFDVAGYESVKPEKPDTALSDDEYQAELDNILERHATISPLEEDRPVANGDWVEIGFTGKLQELAEVVGEDKPEPQPITGEDVLLHIGGKNTLPAFTDGLTGTRVGQELSLEVAYPADFGDARLAGKTVDYDITVKAIKRKDFPERNDEFARELGSYESWADFEAKIREYAGARKAEALTGQARDKMIDEIVAKYSFPLPESFVQQQIDARLERGLRALAQQGMSADAMRQMDFGRLREAQRDSAISEVRASLVLDRIAEKEGITVTDDDLERELLMLSIQSREPLDALRKRLTEDGSIDRIREQMRREKTGRALYDKLSA